MVRIAGAVTAALAVVLLCVVMLTDPFGGDEPSVARPAAEATSSAPTAPPRIADTLRIAQRQVPGNPSRIIVPELAVDAPVVPITAAAGVLDPPSSPQVIGWWSQGAQPGASQGSALLTGHTLRNGGAALQDLETLESGARISVRTSTGTLDYAVADVRVLTKDELAAQAEVLFDQTSEGRLVVITCEDWDGKVWQSNVVVTALPA
jgi:LPXTG-site transpeptidase (sortase) family protein